MEVFLISDVVSWAAEFPIKTGQLDSFKALVEEMVKSTRNEPNTLAYEWFFDGDNNTCHAYERYAGSAATMTHLGTFGEKFAERLLSAVDVSRFMAYGAPNDDVKGVLGGFGSVFLGQLNGFAQQGHTAGRSIWARPTSIRFRMLAF